MDKTKLDEALSRSPIAKRIVAKMKLPWQRKVVNIKNVIAGHAMAEELQKTVLSQKELEGFHPAHAAYVYAQNQVSWAFFDACAGPANETIGTVVLEVGATFGTHPELLRLMRLMQDSRMGVYIHRGGEGDASVLEDLVTGAVYRAIVPAGYKGQKNENWYVRLLPPPFPGDKEHVAFTTPYIVVHPDFGEWLAYFRRTFPATAGFADYERHMKYGPTREYWNDFVFEAYVNHQADAIYLAGLPDIPESRPHSEVSQVTGWKGIIGR